MPVTVEVLTNINDQDYQDIAKSYQQWLTNSHSSTVEPLPSLEQFWTQWCEQSASRLYVARFNGRVIGWALVNQSTAWKLVALCICMPNQGRGVGQRVIQVLTEQAAEAVRQLVVDQPIIYFEKSSPKT
ncbi:acetyl-CoA sensor PanZ family protein [Spartinivicinus ruber]|uniref:acetyl-CoA sensor PanZ family protein n=1 Tax=Spartinivicinus ruber TaxID=2683272 RepID=UPI0013D5015E|nr:acetyl-CoA sensor PanZ family protein [Spartinivicinus ruber]